MEHYNIYVLGHYVKMLELRGRIGGGAAVRVESFCVSNRKLGARLAQHVAARVCWRSGGIVIVRHATVLREQTRVLPGRYCTATAQTHLG